MRWVRPGHRPVRASTDSYARDHLANERTFLAWIRTALGLIGLGVIVAKLVETEGLVAEFVGTSMIVLGGGMVVYAIARYEKVTALLDDERFQAASWGPLILAALTIVAAVGGLFLAVT